MRLSGEIRGNADELANWGLRSCRATGTEPEHQRDAAEKEYHGILTAAEEQLKNTRYLLGERPCAVDAAVLGGLRAHIHHDPIPDLSAFPEVVGYLAGRRDAWNGTGELAPFPESTPFARHLQLLATGYYAPFVETELSGASKR
ncbi:MAG: glutathione S-transferase [Gammaproteobacteria bacterium]